MRRRRFLRTVGIGGATFTSGCSRTILSDSQTQRGTRSTAGGSSSEKDTASSSDDGSSSDPSGVISGIYNADRPLEPLEEWLGRKLATELLYVDAFADMSWVTAFIESYMTSTWEKGHIPILVWHPYISPRDQTPANIEVQIADGAFDEEIRTWAAQLTSWVGSNSEENQRRRFYFVPSAEMNGAWHPWSAVDTDPGETMTRKTGFPEDYVRMWKRIHGIFSNAGLDESTIQWVWTANSTQAGGVRTERYYPGDDFVDWIGLDGYNYGDINQDSSWQTPEEHFEPMVERMRKLTTKPLALPEVSTTSYVDGAFRPQRKAKWIEQLFSFTDDTDLKMICWYNFDSTGEWESDWAIFGGAHGTDTSRVAGTTYNTYDTYKRHLEKPSTINARNDHPRILTDSEFAGRF